MNRDIMLVILLLFSSLISGCATQGETYKFYSGEILPPQKLATIKPFHEISMVPISRTDVYIIEIDGMFTEHHNLKIPVYEILPGEHKLKLGFYIMRGGKEARGVVPEYMVFKAKAGHRYVTKGNFPKTLAEGQTVTSFWIEDLDSNKVIAGTRPVQSK